MMNTKEMYMSEGRTYRGKKGEVRKQTNGFKLTHRVRVAEENSETTDTRTVEND